MEATLVICKKDEGMFEQVLMAVAQRDQGAGLLNFPGGKVRDGMTQEECAIDELFVEVGLQGKVEDLQKVAFLKFYFDGQLKYSCHVYFLLKWEGAPRESEEMKEPHWYLTEHLPYKRMWLADLKWLPDVLAGSIIKEGSIHYNEDATEVLSCKLTLMD